MKQALFILMTLSVLLTGCASTVPTRFYTLVPPLASGAANPDARYAVEVLPVQIPSQVDLSQMVIRTGDGELAISENHQWIAPLPDDIRAALSAHLTAELGVLDVYRVSRNKGQELYRVRTRIQRFESLLSNRIQLQAIWAIEPGPGSEQGRSVTCSSRFEETADAGYAGLIHAHQAALKKLARNQSKIIKELTAGSGKPDCPK